MDPGRGRSARGSGGRGSRDTRRGGEVSRAGKEPLEGGRRRGIHWNAGVPSQGPGANAQVCFWGGQGGPQVSGTSGPSRPLGQSDSGPGSRGRACGTQGGRSRRTKRENTAPPRVQLQQVAEGDPRVALPLLLGLGGTGWGRARAGQGAGGTRPQPGMELLAQARGSQVFRATGAEARSAIGHRTPPRLDEPRHLWGLGLLSRRMGTTTPTSRPGSEEGAWGAHTQEAERSLGWVHRGRAAWCPPRVPPRRVRPWQLSSLLSLGGPARRPSHQAPGRAGRFLPRPLSCVQRDSALRRPGCSPVTPPDPQLHLAGPGLPHTSPGSSPGSLLPASLGLPLPSLQALGAPPSGPTLQAAPAHRAQDRARGCGGGSCRLERCKRPLGASLRLPLISPQSGIQDGMSLRGHLEAGR